MDEQDLDTDPLRQLLLWHQEAGAAGEPSPESMCVATVSADGLPSARMVLLRGLDTGLVFYTDYSSAKGAELAATGRAAALLHWRLPAHRQVRASGPVERTSAAESDRYWATRPPGSRRSAVASHQSTVIASRSELEQRVAELGTTDPPRPDRWGGVRILPETVEFWREGADRLHDRIRASAGTGTGGARNGSRRSGGAGSSSQRPGDRPTSSSYTNSAIPAVD